MPTTPTTPRLAALEAVPEVVASPPVLYAVAFVGGILLNWSHPPSRLPAQLSFVLGPLLLFVGGMVAVWANRTMLRAGTAANPSLPSRTLVVSGPFRYSRNPLYMARILLYVGLALVMNATWPLVSLAPLLLVLRYGVIGPEERYLAERFGDDFVKYRARVGRWFWRF